MMRRDIPLYVQQQPIQGKRLIDSRGVKHQGFEAYTANLSMHESIAKHEMMW